jgi:hypothetical protein
MALAEAAVHHDVQTLYLQQMAGAGDAFFSADVDDVWPSAHGRLLF